jgi:DnaJ-domain-containing protein 1
MRDGNIAFYSSFDEGLLAAIRANIPAQHRHWIGSERYWLVSPQYAQVCADIALQYLKIRVDVPSVTITQTTNTTQLLKLEYLGAAKDRGDNQQIAFGWVNGGWNVIFPLATLRAWFEPGQEDKPVGSATLYGVLGVGPSAKTTEIKSAYRRAARTWHPDRNPEQDAADQFRRIQRAWEVLQNPAKRAKYDAGLRLTASIKHDRLPRAHKGVAHYRPPLRCGYVLTEGIEQLGRFTVKRILQWQDIVDSHGKAMVSYWSPGAKAFERKWV